MGPEHGRATLLVIDVVVDPVAEFDGGNLHGERVVEKRNRHVHNARFPGEREGLGLSQTYHSPQRGQRNPPIEHQLHPILVDMLFLKTHHRPQVAV